MTQYCLSVEMAAHIQKVLTIEIAPIIIHQDLAYITNVDFIKSNHQFSVKMQT